MTKIAKSVPKLMCRNILLSSFELVGDSELGRHLRPRIFDFRFKTEQWWAAFIRNNETRIIRRIAISARIATLPLERQPAFGSALGG